tara:strand:- start:718 stop:1041 length:324 start_codon:yes stop_codon:yes gene_type:complete
MPFQEEKTKRKTFIPLKRTNGAKEAVPSPILSSVWQTEEEEEDMEMSFCTKSPPNICCKQGWNIPVTDNSQPSLSSMKLGRHREWFPIRSEDVSVKLSKTSNWKRTE